jgi:hypothetical protein
MKLDSGVGDSQSQRLKCNWKEISHGSACCNTCRSWCENKKSEKYPEVYAAFCYRSLLFTNRVCICDRYERIPSQINVYWVHWSFGRMFKALYGMKVEKDIRKSSVCCILDDCMEYVTRMLDFFKYFDGLVYTPMLNNKIPVESANKVAIDIVNDSCQILALYLDDINECKKEVPVLTSVYDEMKVEYEWLIKFVKCKGKLY